jgi:hypothetical protein
MEWKVGDPVVVTDVNAKGPTYCSVTKVGRKYVFANGIKFNANTRSAADAYGHQSIATQEEYRARQVASEFTTALRRLTERNHRDAVALRIFLSSVHALVMDAGKKIGDWTP